MEDNRFFGAYASFLAADKPSGELLQGADYIIGDTLDIEFRTEDGTVSPTGEVAWVKNRFGGYAGYLDEDASHKLRICAARGWTLRALLSFVAFTDSPEPGFYWGQVALLCFDPMFADIFDAWTAALASKFAEGARVHVALNTADVDKLIASGGTWVPAARADIPMPEQGKTAILKKTRSFSDRMVEQGRERRPGCMIIGWVFNIALGAGIIALVLHLFGVF